VVRKKIAELGYDDCGEDHTPLMYMDSLLENRSDLMCYAGYAQESCSDLCFEMNYECFLMNFEADLLPENWLFGCDCDMECPFAAEPVSGFCEFMSLYPASRDDGSFVDVIEFCGGNARTSSVLVRRRYKVKVGQNFDLTTGIDLLNQSDIAYF